MTVVDDTTSIYVQDNTPANVTHYRARFYFDPNSLAMANGDTFNLLFGYNSTNNAVVVVEFHKSSSGQYQLHSGIRDDASTWTYTSYVTISDDVHLVESDWQASTGAGANNGNLAFYLDGALQQTMSGIDNDTRSVDYVRLGAVSSLDATTSGTFYLDAFESHTASYIGPAYGAALPLYTGRGSVTAYIGGSASLPYSYGLTTPYPTPTSQPGLTTSTYSYAAQSGTCPDGALTKPHAVTSVGSDTYCYDKNGNMVKRVEGGTTYTQVFDIENRLTSVTVGGVTTTFVYDGDGNLVKKVKGTTTTHYVGAYEVELNSGAVTKKTTYYGPAMRVDVVGGTNTVYYMLADHLGSASVLLKSDGTVETNGEQRYYPFGESRITTADLKTDHLFTGQRDVGLGGLYHFGARFYLPKLGRFISADTIVPEGGSSRGLNRYTYAANNPLMYIDPTGHEFQVADCDTNHSEGTSPYVLLPNGAHVGQAECWAYNAMGQGNYTDPSVDAFTDKLMDLLHQSKTFRLLEDALKRKGLKWRIRWQADAKFAHDSAGNTIQFATADIEDDGDGKNYWWTIRINSASIGELSKIDGNGSEFDKYNNVTNTLIYLAASKIAHELFHVAIGDANGGARLGDDTGTAYRVEGKIAYEMMKAQYSSMNITIRDFAKAWNYPQIAGMTDRGAYEALAGANFRVNAYYIKAVLKVNPKSP